MRTIIAGVFKMDYKQVCFSLFYPNKGIFGQNFSLEHFNYKVFKKQKLILAHSSIWGIWMSFIKWFETDGFFYQIQSRSVTSDNQSGLFIYHIQLALTIQLDIYSHPRPVISCVVFWWAHITGISCPNRSRMHISVESSCSF